MARTLIIAVIVLATYATENHGEVRGLNRYFKALDINVPPDVDPLLDVSEIQNDESSINTLRCNDWYSMAWSFKKCLNVTETGFPSISDLRMTLENFCSKQSVVEHCMEREFRGCENVADLEAMLATSMSFCVGGNIPYVMELYLAFHAQLNITQECWMTVILDIQKFSLSTCSNYLRDKNEGLVEVQRFWKSMIDWYAACAASQDLDVIIEACQLSRRQMFSILLASLQVMFGFGLNHYPNFEAYMKDLRTVGWNPRRLQQSLHLQVDYSTSLGEQLLLNESFDKFDLFLITQHFINAFTLLPKRPSFPDWW